VPPRDALRSMTDERRRPAVHHAGDERPDAGVDATRRVDARPAARLAPLSVVQRALAAPS
jgi:hypothetical protein